MTTKKIIYTGLSTLVIAGSFLLYYFNFLRNVEKIAPPLSLKIPYDTLSFRVDEGINYHHFTGSNVLIPKNAFVDKEGFPVIGNVSVLYREFHSPEEIFLSGIPMGNMDDESNKALQSAGMFEMKASQNGKELEVADGKKINVELAAFRASGDYKIFQLNKNSEWDEKGNPELKDNEKKKKDLATLPELPDEPEGPMLIDVDADYTQYPDLVPFKKYRWAVADVAENKRFMKNQWAFRVNWDRMKVEVVDKSKNLYKLTARVVMKDYDNKTVSKNYSVIVTPVLTGADYEKTLAAFNETMKEYKTLSDQIKKEEQRLALEADVLNAFGVNATGVWNCDRYINNQQFVKIKADFDFAARINPYINKVKVYVINQTDNTTQDYSVMQWNSIYLRSGSQTSIVAVLPDNKIAVFDKEEFSKVDFDKVYNGSREYLFSTKTYAADINDVSKLKKML